MAYEFHYTPTGTGVISGKEVLEQTEDAINDLGNTAISGVQEALDKAEQALTNSENAVDDAQTALNTANNAEGVAIQAQTDVSNLSGTVTNIGNRVTTAEGNITNLQGRMTTAEGNITNLQGRMTTAETNIGNLQTAVSTAQATANSAQQTATTARQQSYVFRYSSTALTPSSTNSNTLLDNTDNLKVGDKVIDSSGVLFSITAIDTANSTFTIGTALIDLAQDSDVVHKSGNETIAGVKTFIDCFLGKNLSGQAVDLNDCVDANGGAIHYYYAVSNYTNISNKPENKPFVLESRTVRYVSSIDYIYYQKIYTADYNAPPSIYTRYYRSGSSSWSNWIKDTDKFVTTDTAQTISGTKTFTDDNMIKTSSPKVLLINTSQTGNTAPSSNTASFLRFDGGTVNNFGGVQCEFLTTGENRLSNYVKDITTAKLNSIQQRASSTTAMTVFNADLLAPANDGVTALGSSSKRWSDCQTKLINGLTPSSLSLPDFANRVDIAGYISNLTGATNNYTPSVNGWLYVGSNDASYLALFDTGSSGCGIRFSDGVVGEKYACIPCQANRTLGVKITCTNLAHAYFVPCQGNI